MKIMRLRKGFTIVELLVAMTAFSVMILAVGLLLVYGWDGWRKSTHSVNMQRDAVLAMEQIAREIRNSNITEITDDSDGIYFTALGFVRTNSATILAADIAAFPGVNIDPKSFDVSYAPTNAVTVRFTLFTDRNADRNNYEMTVNTRN